MLRVLAYLLQVYHVSILMSACFSSNRGKQLVLLFRIDFRDKVARVKYNNIGLYSGCYKHKKIMDM